MQKCCTAYVLARKFDFDALSKQFAREYSLNVHRNVVHIVQGASDVFLFDYGVAVIWGGDIEA